MSNFAYPQHQVISIRVNIPNGGEGVLQLSPAEFERVKRGGRMIAGGWRAVPEPNASQRQVEWHLKVGEEWDSLTAAQRLQIEQDTEWLCGLLEKLKLAVGGGHDRRLRRPASAG